jgi:D-alanyl-D-alanine carboxypeptidase
MKIKRFIAACMLAYPCLLLFSCLDDDFHGHRYELQLDFKALMESVCTETGTPGVSVYVISPDHGHFSLAWGLADLSMQEPVMPDQLFRIGSLTKSFTGAAIVKLVEMGMLDLDAPVSRYLDLINNYAPLRDIRVRHLLNMSSGLAEYLDESFSIQTVLAHPHQKHMPQELVALAFEAAPQLLFLPGSQFHYTNTNYILLGMIIEKASGLDYQNFIRKHFLIPLGLDNTYISVDATAPPFLARGYYDADENGVYEDWTEIDMSYVWSAGCVAANAKDTALWMRALATGEIVGKTHQRLLYEGQAIAEDAVYGAGIVTDPHLGIGHNGTVIGYHADAWYDSLTGSTVAVLSNTNAPLFTDDRDPTREIAAGILDRLKKYRL